MKLEHDQVLWLLGSLCGLNRIPFDARLVLQSFPPPHSETVLFAAARDLGFRLGNARLSPALLRKLSSACVAFVRDDAAVGTAPVSAAKRLALLLRGDDERLLYFEAGSTRPQTVSLAQAQELFEAKCYLATLDRSVSEEEATTSPPGFGFRWFAGELLRHKRTWLQVLTASFALQLIGLALPLFTQAIIDKVVVHQTYSTLILIGVGLAALTLFSAGFAWLRQYLIVHTGNRVDAVLGSLAFRHLISLPLRYFEQRPTGSLVARLHAVETIREFLAGAAVSLLIDLPFLAVFIAAMVWTSGELSLIVLSMLALVVAASLAITPLLRKRLNRQFLLGAKNQAFLTEHLAAIETIKVTQMEPRLASRYDDALAAYLAAGFSARQLANGFNVAVNALEQTMTLSVLCLGALLVMRNDGFTVGMLVAFQMYAGRISQPMLKLAGLWQEFQQANIAVKRLGDVMNAPAESRTLASGRAGQGPCRIEARALSFRHTADAPYLYRQLDLVLEPGTLTVLTGPSGCGKSTLAKLLLGLYMPSEGRILIDGRDIGHFSSNELRQYYGVVPQETWLFSGSLYENLGAGSPDISPEGAVQACRQAGIHDFIESLPSGYQTTVGERGVGLSGGQKQRLAIARALLRRPRVLIFDEATSGLDPAAAAQFAVTVNQLKQRMTVLFIAHQIPPELQADRIFNLASATPAEGGVHHVEYP